ncbi:ADP-ribosylglycohydrolase [Sinosporangium album]|uniref:ADP-ribosylglycohydrolase n=1 Tax=Sinosporangium album TaxID=504805 RepID=A0A1G8B6T0_9ACTN|nr:ADP-ribosylglycohydrolase family protein [Sinosporangium album]SDH28713.1 ADP-ribosylglycohydrolase [Sinosporangium album]
MTTRDRSRGALLGLAAGDALGAPTEGMTQAAIRESFGRVTGFLSDDAAGTDDTEYAVLCAQGLLRYGTAMTPADVANLWLETVAAQRGGFHGAGFSEMVAIANLRAGLRPPVSGADSYEMWSDGAAMRVAPIGVLCPGDPERAARLAAVDASVSHARDGVHCARAVAAAVAAAMTATSYRQVIDAGLAALPEDTWSRRLVTRALDLVAGTRSLAEAEDVLYARIPLFHYPWADAAPEAVALAFGLFAAGEGRFLDVVLGGVNIGRDSDTIAAMTGAMAGALHGASAIPAAWRDQVRQVSGRCIATTAGTDLVDLADALHAAAAARDEVAADGA